MSVIMNASEQRCHITAINTASTNICRQDDRHLTTTFNKNTVESCLTLHLFVDVGDDFMSGSGELDMVSKYHTMSLWYRNNMT